MEPGQLLHGRYQLTERIASGGMGEVWRGVDTRLRRVVAIKVLHSALSDDPKFRHRFVQEAHTVAAVNEPGIINIFDAGVQELGNGRVTSFLVMEFIAGRPLSAIIAEHGRIASTFALRILGQVADGLDAAHRNGIIHRDVKPANIIVDDDGNATLIDFGIARRQGDGGLTATGAVMGTVEYASPEQLHGHELTAASDIYSLGVVGYESLCGSRPFDGETVAAIIAGHIDREPSPLPQYVPEDVARIIGRALVKDPEQRFATAALFSQACSNPQPMYSAIAPVSPANVHGELPPQPTLSQHANLEPVDQPRPKRKPSKLIVALVIVGLLIVAAVGSHKWWPNINADDGQQGSPDPAISDSSSAPPGGHKPPDQPAQVMNDKSGGCLDIGTPGVHVVKCNVDLDQDFTFSHPVDAGKGAYRIADEGRTCAFPADGNSISADICASGQHNWILKWIRTDSDSDVWLIKDATQPAKCMTYVEARVESQQCQDGRRTQRWHTLGLEPGEQAH